MDQENLSFTRKVRRFYKKRKLLTVFLLLLAIPLTVYLVRTFTLYLSRAATAELLFSTSSLSLPPNSNAGIVVNSGSAQIAFARVELTFDQTKVNLSDEINVNGPLRAVIGKTSKDAANSSGRIVVVVALCNAIDIPCQPQPQAPSGTFELFQVPLTAVSSQSEQTELTYDVSQMQLVDTAQTNVSLGAPQPLPLNLNGFASTTPTGNQATSTPRASVTPADSRADTSLQLKVDLVNVNPIPVSKIFPVYVEINSGTNNVIGTDLVVEYDPSKLTLDNISAGNFFTNPDVTNKIIDNTAGRGVVTVATPPGSNPRNGVGNVAVFRFKAIGAGTTVLNFGNGTLVAATGISGANAIKEMFGRDLRIVNGILGDINEDGCVDIVDYAILFTNFGKSPTDAGADPRADINSDNKINILDYSYIFENFSQCI